jgi:hypothetical protein
MWFVVVILLILALFGAPVWPYASGWGWGPSGILGVFFFVLLIWLLFGAPRGPRYGGPTI